MEGEWKYVDMVPQELVITNPDGTTSPISQEQVTTSKKTLSIHDSPSGGNSAHLSYIKEKVGEWVSRMSNGNLPSHMAWVAYRHQQWPGVQYGLGTMTNDLEITDNLLHKEDYRMLNVLGVVCSVTKGLRWLHTSFGGWSVQPPGGTINMSSEHANAALSHFH